MRWNRFCVYFMSLYEIIIAQSQKLMLHLPDDSVVLGDMALHILNPGTVWRWVRIISQPHSLSGEGPVTHWIGS